MVGLKIALLQPVRGRNRDVIRRKELSFVSFFFFLRRIGCAFGGKIQNDYSLVACNKKLSHRSEVQHL